MATVSLNWCYLADIVDLANPVVFGSSDRSDDLQLTGEIREMANGRLRSVSRVTDRRTIGVTATYVDAATVQRIKDFRGKTVLFRDVWGRKVYGTFFQVSVKDYKDRKGQDVSFNIQKISYLENV